jgi:adenylate cyclase
MHKPVFVARDRELGQLDGFLDRALAGQGRVCFVTGEAGSGKTALVTEFARRAQEQHKDLVVAVGQSDAQTGGGDAYLPFREVLSQLTGDVEAELARGAITQENAGRLRGLLRLSGQALVEVGPDLVGIFVPGAGLAMRVGGFVAEKVGWLEKLERLAERQREGETAADSGIEQSHIFEQYTNVLKALAVKQPLMLVLDDLQWADGASIDLLFRLGRRIGESPILIVCTYRPDEVALGRPSTSSGQVERHPLEKVLAEFKRYLGDVRVDLAKAQEDEGVHFVDAFVDTEPNQLGEGFRGALYHHTGGHPLFTIELLRDMQERGDLVQDEDGRWMEGPVLDWEELPARVEGVIEERVGRLERELREALTVASVEGEDFTAEVVAGVQAADARGLIRRLSGELEKQHRLVNAQGIRRMQGQRLSLYRFQHNLFQAYLYNELDGVERAVLHEDVGNVLEELYGDQTDDIAVQLARHFGEAGVAEKASVYLRRAGELAAARYANDEAVHYLSRALELTPEEDLVERCDLLLAREKVYDLQGEREAQAQDLAALEALAEGSDDSLRLAEVALRRSRYAGEISDYPAALAAARMAIRSAQGAGDRRKEAEGYALCGMALRCQGDYDAAQTHLEIALALARDSGAHRTEANSLNSLAIIHVSAGDFAQASKYFEQALQIFQEIGDRQREIAVLSNLGAVTHEQGNHAQAEPHYERALRIAREIGEIWVQGATLNNLGNCYEELGDYTRAEACHEQAMRMQREVSDLHGEAKSLTSLARIFAKQGDYDKGRAYYQRCLDIFREIGDRQGETVALSFLSLLCHRSGEDEAALEHGQLALDIARQLGDRNTQAYPLTYLGHALVGLDRLAEAEDAYRQAMSLRREFGQPHLAMEPLAGLARVSLAQNDLTQAQTYVEEILDFLKDGTLDGTEEPFRVYLTCYRVLHANHDPRAQVLLATAHRLLQDQAAKIEDEGMRRFFLENMPAHREIMCEFARTQ